MVPANLYLFLLTIWLLVFHPDFAKSREFPKHNYDDLPSPTGCLNCTICPYPCHTLTPPPSDSSYPLYQTPPPPSPDSGYPLYGAPPPPPPAAQGNCTLVPVQCCHYPPPTNPYTYIPNQNNSPYPCSTLSLFSVVILLISRTFLF